MTYAPAAPEFERLPWLKDEKKPEPANGMTPLVLWSLFAALLIAGVSYWLGISSAIPSRPFADSGASATIALPEPVTIESEADEGAELMPQVEPVAPPPPVSIAKPKLAPAVSRPREVRNASAKDRARDGSSSSAHSDADEESSILELWPADQSEGAAGRAVRIGTYSTRRQAKIGWRQIVRTYPGIGRLQAVVVPHPSLRNGRTYYRLQFGTTSQAHSAVLCQWMRSVAQSCVIIGQPADAADG